MSAEQLHPHIGSKYHMQKDSLLSLQATELESAVAEQAQCAADAETTLKLKELEFERRATELEKEHAAKMAAMLQQMSLLRNQDAVEGGSEARLHVRQEAVEARQRNLLRNQDTVHRGSEARPQEAVEARQGAQHEPEGASQSGRQIEAHPKHAKQEVVPEHSDAIGCWWLASQVKLRHSCQCDLCHGMVPLH